MVLTYPVLASFPDQQVSIPVRTVSESNMREHWTKKAKRAAAQRGAVLLSLRCSWGRATPFDNETTVTLTRVAPRKLDDDNLRGALKSSRDAVAEWLGIDDRDPRCEWLYDQSRGATKEYAVVIGVTRWRRA